MLENDKTVADKPFAFDEKGLMDAHVAISQYPDDRKSSAVMQLLYIAQNQLGGYISENAIRYIAEILDMPIGQVKEVVGFYTMYNVKRPGRYLIQVCRTISCYLCSAKLIREEFERVLDIKVGETTKDRLFTLKEIECLGACVSAPVIQINDDYYENVTTDMVREIIEKLKKAAE